MLVLTTRRAAIQQAMADAQESANAEDKGSAGDKYETGRAMSQLNKEMHAKQLEETNMEISALQTVNTEVLHNRAGIGAVVRTPLTTFYIAVGLGVITIYLQRVAVVSAQAPVALAVLGKQAGQSFTLNGKATEILDVF